MEAFLADFHEKIVVKLPTIEKSLFTSFVGVPINFLWNWLTLDFLYVPTNQKKRTLIYIFKFMLLLIYGVLLHDMIHTISVEQKISFL